VEALKAQDRLRSMPGYENYRKQSPKIAEAMAGFKSGGLATAWAKDSLSFTFWRGGKAYRYTLATQKTTETSEPEESSTRPRRRRGGGGVERGRQFTSSLSPNRKLKAYTKDNNFWLSDPEGGDARAITTTGSKEKRLKFGTASWVYGEELFQNSAMWWSPDSRYVAFYGFDESKVKDYYLTLNSTQFQSTLDTEPYPKAGMPNPVVEVYVYDTQTQKTTTMDIRYGKPFQDDTVGYYAYSVRWTADSRELLMNRTNRLQNVMEISALNPQTGKLRVIVREESPKSWTDNSPAITFLSDNQRFILTSERNGWKNFYLYDLSGKLICPLTQHTAFEVESIVRIDETAGTLYYMARSGDNHLKLQLHRVNLNGSGERRLTDPKFHHQIDLASDGKHFLDIAQTHAIPPTTQLLSAEGKVLETLGVSDLTSLDRAGVQRAELFSYKSADNMTDLYGMLYKPTGFDPKRRYPLLVIVYAGPESGMLSENFAMPQMLTEYGFLVAMFDGRGTNGRGKQFKDAMYRKCGVVEIDDQAAGVRALGTRPYVDAGRVGIFGTSYGGYASLMCLLRHPDVFQAASASSSVTDWRQYDTIYTERYMGLPEENSSGYNAGSAMTYASDLKGRLMIYFGTADNNVHPANSLQLIQKLQGAGKSFEVQVGPDQGHTGLNNSRMMEFFIENLVLKTPSSR
jgi:dipeptidyl-peptidase-4